MQETRETGTSRPAAVYRLWDGEGRLLYVGSSYDPEVRVKGHRRAPWWPLVARRTDEWHVSREAAYDAEGQAIIHERPVHNVVGTPRHTGPTERGRVQREASDARWLVALRAVRNGATEEEARMAGGWAEVEYLEASGLLPRLAAKWRDQMEREGGTDHSRRMELPSVVNGRLTWEMRVSEVRAAVAAGAVVRGSWVPQNAERWARLEPELIG